jgi:hypothetical protein
MQTDLALKSVLWAANVAVRSDGSDLWLRQAEDRPETFKASRGVSSLVCCWGCEASKLHDIVAHRLLYKLNISIENAFCFGSFRRGTWCCPVWQYERLRMHENRAMKRIFGPKRDKVTAWWGKLHVVMRSFVVDLVFCVWEVKLLLEERQLSGRRIFRREYVEIKCQLDATDEFLLQILLLAQHVSGTIMPIIRNSRVLYK